MRDTQETLTDTFKTESRSSLIGGDRYLAFLAIVLLGYAVMGKGFAYLGFPPLYVGEIAFLSGIIVFLRSGAFIGAVSTLPATLLVALMTLVLVRTLPFVGQYGFDALRDSAIVIYGGFAFITIGLLLEDARRINVALRYYGTMLTSLPAMFVGLLLAKYWGDEIPMLYGPVPIVDIGPSAVGTHLAGTMVFVLIGYRRVSFLWAVLWFATLALVCATNRGATLAVIVPIAIAMLALGRYRQMLVTVVMTIGIFAALLALESTFGDFEEAKDSMDRPVSAHQIVENAKSIIGQSGEQAEGTKQWRLNWWDVIINDTIYGPNFWTGRGFGINLADADGFYAGDPRNPRPPTRSPHSAHMTLLARAGIPGLMLWALVLVSWFALMTRAILSARTRGHERWVELFIFIACYTLAILINASFDVVLEGPMQGIWFWCLFGFGVGSVMVYRAQPFTDFRR
ncbi:O-antigen polymerase precursor [Bradyrhizobium sp. STM 3843]|uniref:O-antigen ligase family protein n=1 Tax=Bradyrhizobium sp. STM 3843 TaxID=551947 RepID=UPI000240AAE1|nr:O-antigen ligase family protein [Bradyrhizobium sp. STM 3843]CCE05608.1 O-antigen polymerase precursor [Bradyrhizobium sp. STM 3843]